MTDSKDIVEQMESWANDVLASSGSRPPAAAVRALEAAAHIRALRSALRECSDDLAEAVRDRRSYQTDEECDRDMAPVLRARALLDGRTE